MFCLFCLLIHDFQVKKGLHKSPYKHTVSLINILRSSFFLTRIPGILVFTYLVIVFLLLFKMSKCVMCIKIFIYLFDQRYYWNSIPKIWNFLSNECKISTTLVKFKVNIKKWIPENYPCRLCKTYIQYLGFV